MNCQTGSGDICVKSVYADNSSFRSESGSVMLNSCHGNSQVDVGSGNLNVGKSHRQAVLMVDIFRIGIILMKSLKNQYCKFGNFREDLISQNLAYAKFRENETLAKWLNHSVVY